MNNISIRWQLVVCVIAGLSFGLTKANATDEPWCFYDDPALYYARTADGIDEARSCEKQWPDPQTLPEELALPMPCGRRMLFRRVDLELTNILDHRRIYMGKKAQSIDALRSGSGEAVVAGAFSCTGRVACAVLGATNTTDTLKPRRIYYMGKYEVTAPQYALETSGAFETGTDGDACKVIDAMLEKSGDLAAAGMSWFEAVAFTRLYTEWLLREAPEALPMEGRTRGFLRLPTEAEWEYAARAHWAIEPGKQSQPGYPLARDNRDNEDINRAALWSRSEPPRPPRLRTGPANVFGLWDLAGGVAEMTLDLYRYRWGGLPHGQAGGFIARGLIPTWKARRADVHDRTEIPFYSPKGATRQKTLGFRLMITAPVEVDGLRSTDLEAMGARAGEAKISTDSGRGAAEEALGSLTQAVKAGEVERTELEQHLENVKTQLEQGNVRLREKETENLQRRLVGLVLLAMNIDRQGRHAMALLGEYHATRLEIRKDKSLSNAERQDILKQLAPVFEKTLDAVRRQEDELDAAFQFYLSEVSFLAREDTASGSFATTLGEAEKRLNKIKLSKTKTFLSALEKHVQKARRAQGVIRGEWRVDWLYRLDTKRSRRDEILGRDRKGASVTLQQRRDKLQRKQQDIERRNRELRKLLESSTG